MAPPAASVPVVSELPVSVQPLTVSEPRAETPTAPPVAPGALVTLSRMKQSFRVQLPFPSSAAPFAVACPCCSVR